MRFGGILLAAALLLPACSSDPEPQEPTSAPTPTSTATLPPMPEQAKEDSPEGAAAFVDHWVDVFNYASQTGDVDELTRLSSPDCEGCQSYIDLYRDTYAAGGYFRGGEWEIGPLELREGDQTFITATVNGDESSARASSSASPGNDPAFETVVTFILLPGDSWRMGQLGTGGIR